MCVCLSHTHLVADPDEVFGLGHHGVPDLTLSQVLLGVLQHVVQPLELVLVGLLHLCQEVGVLLPLELLAETLVVRRHV